NIGAAARRKIPSNRGFSISNLNQGMTCARPRTLLRRRLSRAFSAATRPFGSNREGNRPETRMSIADVKRFYQQINTSGRDERASPWRGRDWMNAAFGENKLS